MNFNRKKFYSEYRKAFGALEQGAVDGLEFLLGKFEEDNWTDLRLISYVLATCKHESANTFQPIKEYRSRVGSKGRANQDRYWLSGYYGRGLRQMFPSIAKFNMFYTSARNAVLIGYFFLFSIVRANFQNIAFGKFRIRSFAVCVSFMSDSISRIISHRPRAKMLGITARRVIADVMSDNFVGNIFARNCFIHQTVDKFKFTVEVNTPVTTANSAAVPQPAIISFFNKRKEPFCKSSIDFLFLIARVRTVFCSVSLVNESFSATFTSICRIFFRSDKPALIRAVKSFRSTKRKESFAALKASVRLRYSGVSHFVFSILENELIRSFKLFPQLLRPFSILTQNAFCLNKLEVLS